VRHNLAFDGLLSEFMWRPVTDRPPGLLWGLTRQRHDLTPLLSTEGQRRPWARVVLSAVHDRCGRPLQPMPPPQAHGGARGLQAPGDLRRSQPVGEEQDESCPPDKVLAGFMGAHQRVQLGALGC